MSSKTKILILKKREIIYTAIFIALGVTLLILTILMFHPNTPALPDQTVQTFVPGVYCSPLLLGGNAMELEVRVDKDLIHDIRLVNAGEAVTTTLPLMKPSLDSIASQIYETQSTDNIYYESSSQYTSQMLIEAINDALHRARVR
ncbi:MAG: hypothetical protein Q4B57_01715 [Eubacteriales bacterium]|nr:hypothetical protein [Eubacteriales bacterium]